MSAETCTAPPAVWKCQGFLKQVVLKRLGQRLCFPFGQAAGPAGVSTDDEHELLLN